MRKDARLVALERIRQVLGQNPAEALKLAVQLQAAKGQCAWHTPIGQTPRERIELSP